MTEERKTMKLPKGNRARAKARTEPKAESEPVLRDEEPTEDELAKAKTEGVLLAPEAGPEDGLADPEEPEDGGLDEPTPDAPAAIVDPHEVDEEDGGLALPDLDGEGGAESAPAQAPKPAAPLMAPTVAPQSPPALAPAAHHGRTTVTRMYSKGGELTEEASEEEALEVGVFLTQPAQVSVSYRSTTNLGNYESAQVGVSVSVPCYVEEIDAALAFATRKAEERMAAEVSAIRGSSPEAAGATAVASRDASPAMDGEADGDEDEGMTFALPDLD